MENNDENRNLVANAILDDMEPSEIRRELAEVYCERMGRDNDVFQYFVDEAGLMNLTELEKDCLYAIYHSEYYDGWEKPCIWSFSVADNALITKKKQVCGVISSLIKKGLVACTKGKGIDQDIISVISNEAHSFAIEQGWTK